MGTTSSGSDPVSCLTGLLADGRGADLLAQGVVDEKASLAPVEGMVDVVQVLALLTLGQLSALRAVGGDLVAAPASQRSDAAQVAALTGMAHLAWQDARVADAVVLSWAAFERRHDVPDRAFFSHVGRSLASRLWALGEFTAADRVLDTAEEEQDDALAAGSLALRAGLRLATGDHEEAIRQAELALVAAAQRATPAFARRAREVLAGAALARGDIAKAAEQLSHARQLLYGSQTVMTGSIEPWLRGRVTSSRAGSAQGFQGMRSVYGSVRSHRQLILDAPGAAGWLTRSALVVGDFALVERSAVITEQFGIDNADVAAPIAAWDQVRGLIDRDPVALVDAANGHRQPWARASAFEDAGVVLDEIGARSSAVARHGEALRAYQKAGSPYDVARVRRRIRGLEEPSSTRRRERPISGWSSLTDAEKPVARVVAEGLTNREAAARLFISRHTVDAHLRSIYRKLQINSRVALTRLVVDEGED